MADSDLLRFTRFQPMSINHPTIVGKGLPSESVKTSSGCLIRSSLTYHFSDPDGNPLRQEQILNEDWKEDWVYHSLQEYEYNWLKGLRQFTCCHKFGENLGELLMEKIEMNRSDFEESMTKLLMEKIEMKYPDQNYPKTVGELNRF